ncbi:MAG: VanZ family protein [Dermatophilaceae bacterium]
MADDAVDGGPPSRRRRWLVVAVVVQLLVLYLPRGVAPPSSLSGADKIVHLLVFLVPVVLALRLRRGRASAVVLVFAGHAVRSEVLQAGVLPARSGDIWDVAADLLGVFGGWLAWTAVTRRGRHPASAGGA